MKIKRPRNLRGHVANKLSAALLEEGVSKSELARRLVTGRMYATELTNGSQNLTLDQLERVAAAIDCWVDVSFRPIPKPLQDPPHDPSA